MTAESARRGLLDTNIMILRSRIVPEELPDEMAISAVTLAELSAGPHQVRPDTAQDAYVEAAERARRRRRTAAGRARVRSDPLRGRRRPCLRPGDRSCDSRGQEAPA